MFELLRGVTAVLTRESSDNAELAERLRHSSATVVDFPCIRTEGPEDTRELAGALATLSARDWLVVTSRHGADAIAPFGPIQARVAAVGDATAQRLGDHGVEVAFRPTIANGEQLARELPPTDGRVLLARSERAGSDLPTILRERGFVTREVTAYRTVPAPADDGARVRELLRGDGAVVVLFYSPSAVEGFLRVVDARLLALATIYVSGRSTLRAVRERVGPDAEVALMNDLGVLDVAHR